MVSWEEVGSGPALDTTDVNNLKDTDNSNISRIVRKCQVWNIYYLCLCYLNVSLYNLIFNYICD